MWQAFCFWCETWFFWLFFDEVTVIGCDYTGKYITKVKTRVNRFTGQRRVGSVKTIKCKEN